MENKQQREEKCVFRIYQISKSKVADFEESLVGLDFEVKPLRDLKNKFTIIVKLNKKKDYTKFIPAIVSFVHKHRLTEASYGIWMSVITGQDMDGMTVPKYVRDFYKQVGGSIDFSFITG